MQILNTIIKQNDYFIDENVKNTTKLCNQQAVLCHEYVMRLLIMFFWQPFKTDCLGNK